MIVANLDEMLGHGFDKEYGYKDHTWINVRLSCGCTVALCLDVELLDVDRDLLVGKFNKVSSLNTLIRESLNSYDKSSVEKFSNELDETRRFLSDHVAAKRKQFAFPVGTDCNVEYYYLKLKQGPACSVDF